MLLAPEARVDDGFFNVVIVSDIGRWGLMLRFPLAYRGQPLKHRHFSVYTCRQIEIQSSFPVQRMFDGDIRGQSPVQARVLPRATNVIAPIGQAFGPHHPVEASEDQQVR